MKCMNCGRSLESGMNFCPGCGIPIRKSKVCPICKRELEFEDNCCGYFEEIYDESPHATDTPKDKEFSLSVNMVLVEGGSFQMGSTTGNDNEKPVHQVTLSSFYIGKYEVTQKEYQAVMGKNPSKRKGDDLPVESVSWYNAVDYCNKLSIREGLTPVYSIGGNTSPSDWSSGTITVNWSATGYRLPTEAEWEFAARGGNKSGGYKYSGSNDLDEVAWYVDNSDIMNHPVGSKKPNELGIYDMLGNVWEWCWDYYDDNYYSISPSNNPTGPVQLQRSFSVLRGGSWYLDGGSCRVAYRICHSRSGTYYYIGFRVSRTLN